MTLLLHWTQRQRQQCCRFYHSLRATRSCCYGLLNGSFMVKSTPLSRHDSRQQVPEFCSPWFISSCGFSTRLFVGGLSSHTDEEGLKSAFSAQGDVVEVKIVMDRETGRSKGFGFVTYASDVQADTAIAQMSGKVLNGRTIKVDRAASRPPLPSTRSSAVNSGAGFGSGMSPSSSLPPVADDWGNIPNSFASIQQPSETKPLATSQTPTSMSFGSSLSTNKTSESGSSSFNSSGSSFCLNGTKDSTSTITNVAGSHVSGSTFDATLNSSDNIVSLGSTTSSTSIGTLNSSDNIGSLGSITSSTSIGSSNPSNANKSSLLPASPFLTSDGKFNFSNFSLDNSSRDNDPPLPKRRPRPRSKPVTQTSTVSNINFYAVPTTSAFGSNSESARSTIPRPKGPEYNFGLLDIKAKTKFGAKPQGGYYVEIPDDLPEAPPVQELDPKPKDSGFLMFPQRMLPPLELPWETPEADNWSEIGEDPPKYDLTTLFPSMEPILKKDKEFHWDPYEFDEEAKLPEEQKAACDDSDAE